MNKSFKLTCKNDVLDLIRNQEYQDALFGSYDFSTYGSGHPQLSILSHDGNDIRNDDMEFMLYRRNTLNMSMLQTDTNAYTSYSRDALETAIGSARASLQTHYDELLDKADEVQMEMLYLMILMRLRKRFDIKPVESTGNQWEHHEVSKYEYECERSNMVYRMYYRVYLDHDWNRSTQRQELTGGCTLYWEVQTQSPALGKADTIGGQEKRFKTEEAMKKYLDGRIKAYDKYFTELSPPVPELFLDHFTYAGQLLPGYRVEGS